jgi:putative NADH-flavin reductase
VLLALFGGTGRVGRRLLEYATEERHSVHALVRDPARCPAAIGAIPFQGDIADPDAVAAVLEGADGVLSSLGGAGLNAPGTAISRGMRNIVAGMRRHGVRRVLAVAGSGVLDDPRGGLRADAPDFPDVYRAITREHIGTFEALRAEFPD